MIWNLGIVTLLVLLSTPIRGQSDLSFTLVTMPQDSSGLQQTVMSDQVANSLVGGPAILFGAVPSDVMLQICDKIVTQGQFSFTAEIFMPDYADGAIYPLFNLEATGGCGNPLAPALIQTRFDASTGHTFGIVCAGDAASTGLCPIWIYGSDVSDLWNGLPEERHVRGLSFSRKKAVSDREASAASIPRRLACEWQIVGTSVAVAGYTAGCLITLGLGCPFSVVGVSIGAGSITNCELEQGGCFPGDAVVYKPSGKALISEIKVGDSVATAVDESGSMRFETIYFLGHDDSNAYSTFYQIEMSPLSEKSGSLANSVTAVVEMTAFHFIPVLVASKGNDNWVNTRAKDICLGDIILASSEDYHHQLSLSLHVVSRVTVVKKYGLFNPYTMSGRILVNNVSVSVHSEWILDPVFDAAGLTSWLPQVYQFMLYPLRMLVRLLGVNLYVKTSVASSLTQAITGGKSELEELPTLNSIIMSIYVPGSLLAALFFLQRKGKWKVLQT